MNPADDLDLAYWAKHIREMLRHFEAREDLSASDRACITELFGTPIGELFVILETSEPLGVLYRERSCRIRERVFNHHHRMLYDLSRPPDESRKLVFRLLDDEWRNRVVQFTEESDAPFREEFGLFCASTLREFLEITFRYDADFLGAMERVSYPFQVELAAWQAETAERLSSCYKRFIKDLCRWLIRTGSEFSAWERRVKCWCEQAERSGVELAIIRHRDRELFGRGLVPNERPEDRLLDYLVAEREVSVLDARFGCPARTWLIACARHRRTEAAFPPP